MNKLTSGKFIVFEGMDCTGKTTAIRRVLEMLQDDGLSVRYSKGLMTDSCLGRLARMYPATPTLIVSQLYADAFMISKELSRGTSVLQDRWYYSILSHNPMNRGKLFLESMLKGRLGKPSMLIYCTAALEERLKRLALRNRCACPGDERTEFTGDKQAADMEDANFQRYYDRFSGQKAIIDTTVKSLDDTACEVYRLLKTYMFK